MGLGAHKTTPIFRKPVSLSPLAFARGEDLQYFLSSAGKEVGLGV